MIVIHCVMSFIGVVSTPYYSLSEQLVADATLHCHWHVCLRTSDVCSITYLKYDPLPTHSTINRSDGPGWAQQYINGLMY
jgi:hypothetical protein